MQHISADNSQQSPSGNEVLYKSCQNLVHLLRYRFQYLYCLEREAFWYLLLADSDKKEGIIENLQGDFRIGDCGIILSFGIGKSPLKFRNFSFNDFNDILLIRLNKDDYNEIYYVLCEPGKKHEITGATSADEIKRRGGQILYVAHDADPPEAVSCEIIKNLCQGSSSVRLIPISRPCQAVRKGDIQKVSEYLNDMSEHLTEMSEFVPKVSNNCDFNRTEQNGWTLLHHAAHCGNSDIVRLLVAEGYDIHARDTTCGRLAAHIAAWEGHTETVEYFSNSGVSVDEVDNSGWTLLHYAAWKGSPQTVRFLIKNGARVNVKDKCLGKTPLHVASKEGHVEVIEILLDCGADIDDCDDIGRTAICFATFVCCIEMVKFLFGRNANVEIRETVFGAKPLHVAAFKDSEEVLEFFLDQGADIQSVSSRFSLTPLHFAAMHGSLNTARLLVARGADLDAVDSEGLTPFDRAYDYVDVASYLSVEMIKRFQIQGNYGEVLNIYTKLSEFQKTNLGLDYTETLDTRSNMAKVMYEQGRYVEALDILRDVHARRGCSSKDALLIKCELRLSIREAEIKFNKSLDDLKEVFQKCATDLTADQDVHDPLNVACDIASVYLRNHEYDKMFNIFHRVLERNEPPLSVVQTSTLHKSCDIGLKNRMEGLDSQHTRHISKNVKYIFDCVCVCLMIYVACEIFCFRII